MPKVVVSGDSPPSASYWRPRTQFGLACFVLLAAHPAVGQHAPHVDSQQTEKQIDAAEAEWRRLRAPLPKTPKLVSSRAPTPNIPLFRLNSISVEGSTVLSDDAVKSIYGPYLGRTVSQVELEAIATGIGQLYRDAGFHLSRAVIPPQDIKGGHLRIQVIEGSISEIRIEGEDSKKYGVYEAVSSLLTEHPSRLSSLERKLLLLNNTPGLRVVDTAIEEIGERTGFFRLTLKVQTWRVYTTFGLDNAGSHAVGPLQAYSSTFLNSYLLSGDTIGVNLATVPDATRDLRSGRLSYDAPIGNDGFRFGGSGAYGDVWPSDDRRLIDTRTVNQTYELRGSFSPIQTRQQALTLTGSFGYTEETEKDSLGTDYTDHVRVLRIAADYRLQDLFNGSNYLTAALRQGLNVLGATQSDDPQSSRAGTSPTFSIFEFSYTRYQKLSDIFSLKAALSGQLASEALLSSQAFYLGSAAFGPGYYSGDNGIAGLLELRFDQSVESRWLKGYQLFTFVDAGQVWNVGDAKQSLRSAGAGVRFNIADELYAGISYAVPVSESSKTEEFRSSRILFSLSGSFRYCPDRAQLRCF